MVPSNDNAQPSAALREELIRLDCARAEVAELRREISRLRTDRARLAKLAGKPPRGWGMVWASVAIGGAAALMGGLLTELPAILKAMGAAC